MQFIAVLKRHRQSSSPGAENDLHCELEHFEHATAPPYYALLYVLGDATLLRRIYVDGLPCNVTASLRAALCGMRDIADELRAEIQKEHTERQISSLYVWVDALCLNQADALELREQVPLMGGIYSKALNVFVWLGHIPNWSDERIGPCFELLEHAQHPTKDAIVPPIASWVIMAMALSDCAWFTRLWTVQEYAMSSREPWVQTPSGRVSLDHVWFVMSYWIDNIGDSSKVDPKTSANRTGILPLMARSFNTVSGEFKRQDSSIFPSLRGWSTSSSEWEEDGALDRMTIYTRYLDWLV